MTDIEVQFGDVSLGVVYRYPAAHGERMAFRYSDAWLSRENRFAVDPELFLDARATSPARGGVFGAFADCAPDRWGRQLMQRRERHAAKAEQRTVRTLSELDYVLGVSDVARQGALRFVRDGEYLAAGSEIPPFIKLGALLHAADRVARDQDDAADLALLLAPGSSLGGARPKASIFDKQGRLAIAKFPRPDDEYSVERWEWIALQLAERAGIQVAHSEVRAIRGRDVLLTQRFDRRGDQRVHFASALTLLGLRDGERASYPDIVEVLQREGSRAKQDTTELFRRMVFNIGIANVDDHLRNHGFLRERDGWALSPAYDLNPVPMDIRARVMSTSITPDDATGSLDAARESAKYFGLAPRVANTIITDVLNAIATWRALARRARVTARECDRMESAFLTADAAG